MVRVDARDPKWQHTVDHLSVFCVVGFQYQTFEDFTAFSACGPLNLRQFIFLHQKENNKIVEIGKKEKKT